MTPAHSRSRSPRVSEDVVSILKLFLAWKTLLLAILACSPGPGYDTSADLLWSADGEQNADGPILSYFLTRLVRWDAVYFVALADRGYIHEQEWAFGRGFTCTIGKLAQVIPHSLVSSSLFRQAIVGVVLAHLTHLASSLLVYTLSLYIVPDTSSRRTIARIAAYLYILSPAGIYLSAPYIEAPFAFLNLLGFLALAFRHHRPRSSSDFLHNAFYTITAGILFAVATTFRSNGLLSTLAFAVHALPVLLRIADSFQWIDIADIATLGVGVLGASSGMVLVQFAAYSEYCLPDPASGRPWCTNLPPSIYSWVQKTYWNGGFLKYWTLSNLPLFAIAAPMLLVLCLTALPSILSFTGAVWKSVRHQPAKGQPNFEHDILSLMPLTSLMLPQLALALLDFTSFHVQIINRISSGYPGWYIVLARLLVQQMEKSDKSSAKGAAVSNYAMLRGRERIIGTTMTMYALVQACLYSGFLPPA